VERDDFWKLIAFVDREALHRFDDDAAIAPLIVELAMRDEPTRRGFEEELAHVLRGIDSRAHADHAGESGDSNDAFLYARCFVVASGQHHYQTVLDDPGAMPRTLDEWCESLLYAAGKAWGIRTGRDPEEWDFHASVSYETGTNKAKWA
jgi:hypothetical protein